MNSTILMPSVSSLFEFLGKPLKYLVEFMDDNMITKLADSLILDYGWTLATKYVLPFASLHKSHWFLLENWSIYFCYSLLRT